MTSTFVRRSSCLRIVATRCLLIASATYLCSSFVLAQQPDADVTAAASQPPLVFARELVEAGLPVGLEVRDTDMGMPASGSLSTAALHGASLFTLMDRFNAQHADYDVTISAGVINIRPSKHRPDFLDTAVTVAPYNARGILNIIVPLFSPLDRSLARGVGARAGDSIGAPGVTVDAGESLEMSVNGTGQTVLETLNAIAKKFAGQGWLVVVATDGIGTEILRVGAIHRGGSTAEVPVRRGR